MGIATGFILSEAWKKELQNKLNTLCPHCYFCGSPYVRIMKGEEGSTKATCLVCDRTCFINHNYDDTL